MNKKTNEIVLDIETSGLNAWYGDRVTCICAKDSKGDTFSEAGMDEEDIISNFFDWLSHKMDSCLITFNGKQFDIPFIMASFCLMNCLRHRTSELSILRLQHIDLHEELQKLTGKRISLDTASRIMGCDTKSGKGKDAIELWKQGKFDELKAYCMQDVEVTWQVYQKWKVLRKTTGQDTGRDEP